MASETLEVFQELIPFTNEKAKYPVSGNSTFTNPVVMPLSFDITSAYNTVETVIYIRNNNKDKYYSGVAIMLMAPKEEFLDTNVSEESYQIGSIVCTSGSNISIKNSGGTTKFILDSDTSTEIHPSSITFDINSWFDGDTNDMLPISGASGYGLNSLLSDITDVRFSFGYDEISELDWKSKPHCIVIPNIGNSTMSDNSFIPVRMRVYLNSMGSLYTLKKYALNVCYSSKANVIV